MTPLNFSRKQNQSVRNIKTMLRSRLSCTPLEDRCVPATFLVNSTDNTLDSTITASHMTLMDAISEANATPGSNTVTFDPSLYANGAATIPTELTISGNVTISGPGSGKIVLKAPTGTSSLPANVFNVLEGATVELDGLTLSNGTGANVTTPVQGTTLVGGAINNFGTLTVNDSTFTGNSSGIGGAIYNIGNLTVADSTFNSNQALQGPGGAIYSNYGTVSISNSTFVSNTATNTSTGGSLSSGGAIYSNDTTTSIVNSTITENSATSVNSGQPAVGGGLGFAGGTVSLYNSIVAGNTVSSSASSSSQPGDIDGTLLNSSSNSIVGTDPTSGNLAGGLTSGTNGNIGLQNSTATSGAITADLSQIFGSNTLQNNGGPTDTIALGANSLALGAGSTQVPGYVAVDQTGQTRSSLTPDIGAYQSSPAASQSPLAPVGVPTTFSGIFAPEPSSDGNTAFVKGLYQSLLKRAGDSSGIAAWAADLDAGISRYKVTEAFINSTEYRTDEVTTFYQTLLNRAPDSTGLNYFVGLLQNGDDESDVISQIVSSPEFTSSNSSTQLVNKLYQALLGRPADAGAAGWINALNLGVTSPGAVATGILESAESLNSIIQANFNSFLERAADPNAVNSYSHELQNHRITFGDLQANILASNEFYGDALAHLNS
ncbi:DUF4214 domain-containing protein [Telmatocola sphagniphila]|uniref:DUF4214 domain-containing protein n=1 Tax=Telmatocola sphagniphila TaxID=1123043 RepID=A0A8E6BAI6_9BACT|nr:DUF4214 domain-containing protein [Telmatocola sphagniphila]QVL34161.1 DUF4214 domain-containing protein [Telmatocola sphagniphila]